ncbi:hypothetical protein BDF19DRAFT_440306, partial [Syncephalis fuscata]
MSYSDTFKIHTANNNKMMLLQYFTRSNEISYRIIRILLAPDISLAMNDYSTPQMAQIALEYLNLLNDAFIDQKKVYSIDCNRLLIHISFELKTETSSCIIRNRQRYIKVISLSKGAIFECSYPSNGPKNLLLISTHNLAVFHSKIPFKLVIISLLDGK